MVVDSVMGVRWEAIACCIDALKIGQHICWELVSENSLVLIAGCPDFKDVSPHLEEELGKNVMGSISG